MPSITAAARRKLWAQPLDLPGEVELGELVLFLAAIFSREPCAVLDPRRYTPCMSASPTASDDSEQQGSSLYAAVARSATRGIALYFSRPVRLFRPSKGRLYHKYPHTKNPLKSSSLGMALFTWFSVTRRRSSNA